MHMRLFFVAGSIGALGALPICVAVAESHMVVFDGMLSQSTVTRGITFAHPSDAFRLQLKPHTFSEPVRASIVLHDPIMLSEEMRAPYMLEFVGPLLSFQFGEGARMDASQKKLRQPLKIRRAGSSYARFYFYDRETSAWRALPTERIGEKSLVTSVPFGAADIALMQRKDWLARVGRTGAIQVHAALVVDSSDAVLYATHARDPFPIASITKLMTALVFLEHNPGFSKQIAFRERDRSEPARLSLRVGETLKIRSVFEAMLVGSKNDAANMLEHASGLSRAAFIEAMNEKARAFGMTDTTFFDVSGLDHRNRSTAQDIVALARAAFSNDVIRSALSRTSTVIRTVNTGRTQSIRNTNPFIKKKESVIHEGKTGYIDESGYNFVARARVDERDVIAVVFGAPSSDARFRAIEKIVAGRIDTTSLAQRAH